MKPLLVLKDAAMDPTGSPTHMVRLISVLASFKFYLNRQAIFADCFILAIPRNPLSIDKGLAKGVVESLNLSQFYLFRFILLLVSRPIILVSTLEKSSKKSSSPTAPSPPPIKTSPIKAHDELKLSAPVDSHSVPLANSLDLSSDDDHLDKLTGASSSTTTTSSSFFENKRLGSFEDEIQGTKPTIAPLSIIEQFKTSNTSLNVFDTEHDVAIGNETSMRYRIEQQRKGSLPSANNNQTKAGEHKVSFKGNLFLKLLSK